jgi:hypothetical protein
LRLPRDGIARRFGVQLLDELDRAGAAGSRAWFTPPRASPRASCCLRRCRRRRRVVRGGTPAQQMEGFSPRGTPACASSLDLEHEAASADRRDAAGPARAEKHFRAFARAPGALAPGAGRGDPARKPAT